MKLIDVKVKYTHPAMINGINVDTEYVIVEENNEFYINKMKFSIEDIKAFFNPIDCKWEDVEFEVKKVKPTK